jgi:hypothetical protein
MTKPKSHITAHVVGRRLVLTRDARSQCFRGDWPSIVLPGDRPCTIEPGYRYDLGPELWLEITDKRRTAKGDHSLVYMAHDRRDKPKLLRRVPPAHDLSADGRDRDSKGRLRPLDEDTQAVAAEESAYTSSPSQSVADAGEAPSSLDAKWGKGAAKRHREGKEFKREQQDLLSAERRTAELMKEAKMRGVDVSKESRLLEKLKAEGRKPDAPLKQIRRKLDGAEDMRDAA